eukprot:CAMPEP_0197867398 /NCGR_PEP_ID=MMETSP1438-20131217/44735_1 /TAXON_ID=1461541 /ORGANISM="Pterosperma sp., Strain CCMP1384" /LENGTH=460 /DNA_ID=CAMNT_0043486045 /DNA_START=554 /DNA_END=1936 /DNA_ORIENTATION=+
MLEQELKNSSTGGQQSRSMDRVVPGTSTDYLSPRVRRPSAKVLDSADYCPTRTARKTVSSSHSEKSQPSRLDSLLEAALDQLSTIPADTSEVSSVPKSETAYLKETPKATTPRRACSTERPVAKNSRSLGDKPDFEFDTAVSTQSPAQIATPPAKLSTNPQVQGSPPVVGPPTPTTRDLSQANTSSQITNMNNNSSANPPLELLLTPPTSPVPTSPAVTAAAAAAAAARVGKCRTWISGQQKMEAAMREIQANEQSFPSRSCGSTEGKRQSNSNGAGEKQTRGEVEKESAPTEDAEGECSNCVSPSSDGAMSEVDIRPIRKRYHNAAVMNEESAQGGQCSGSVTSRGSSGGVGGSAKRACLMNDDQMEAEYERTLIKLQRAPEPQPAQLGKLNLQMAMWCFKRNKLEMAERCILQSWDAFLAISHHSNNMKKIANSFVDLLESNNGSRTLVNKIKAQSSA